MFDAVHKIYGNFYFYVREVFVECLHTRDCQLWWNCLMETETKVNKRINKQKLK